MHSFVRASLASTLVLIGSLAACGEDAVGVGGGSSSGDTKPDASTSASTSSGGTSSGGSSSGSSSGSSGVLDASADAETGACDTTGYPLDYTSTPEELESVHSAIDTYEAANPGVTVTLDEAQKDIAAVGGLPALTLDAAIVAPCERATAALLAYLEQHADIFRAPPGMTLTSCLYDDVYDADVLRLQGGTYFGRPMLGQPSNLLAHVTRDGHLRYFDGTYTPVLERANKTACLSASDAAAATIGYSLGYQKFQACVPQGGGSIVTTEADTRTPLETGVFRDELGKLHNVRAVDVLLAAGRVGYEQTNSDLFCCAQIGVVGCVGKTLLIDELTGEVLAEIPRCHTC